MRPANLDSRVARERAAHTEDDVLARSAEVKARFPHVWATPGYKEMIRRRNAFIAAMKDMRVLDYGCGPGDLAVQYLKAGAAHVTGIDISSKYVEDAGRRCKSAGFADDQFEFRVMDAHDLQYDDASFDMVIGNGILHHLDLPVAMDEIKRVLAPRGRAMFQEPLADNPLLRLFRLMTPKARTVDERPLNRADLDLITAGLESQTFFFGLFSSPTAALTSVIVPRRPSNRLVALADRMERPLRHARRLESWHQYALLDLRRP